MVFVLLTACFSFLIPAVNQARYEDEHAPILDGFTPFTATNGWSVAQQLLFIPVIAFAIGATVAALLVIVRALLPRKLRQRIVWLPTKGPVNSATKRDWLRVTAVAVFLCTVLYLSIIFMPR